MKLNIYSRLSLMLLLCFGLSSVAVSQNTITGKIMDDSGEALIGANILIKGTSIGTISDIDGSFSISSSRALPITLVASYTGYSATEVTVTDRQPISITLTEGILGDQIVISASRKREKVQEAPASISVISARKLETSPNATDPTRNLVNTAGVQVQQQSANRINISMRGGAGLFGTSVFPIMDYRSLVGPGIGTFQTDQAGISNIDLQKIEVVRGPGSALYGPGVTQGVVHFITKNPIDFPGTAVEILGGELSTIGATVRHATKVSDKFGFKINAQYRQGDEFTLDPNDPDDALQIAKFTTNGIFQPAVSGGIVDVTQPPTQILTQDELDEDGDGNPMQSDWFNTAINATLEFRPADDLSLFVSGGFNQASSIFYNEQGEGLAQGTEFWGQARVQKGGFFAQVFAVNNDGGSIDNPTFLYQTGNRSPVGRQQLEAQAQYNFGTPSFLDGDWTVGFDYRFAGQDTENLVYGRNEEDDDFSVVGGYVQGKFGLGDKLDLVLAGRYDRFNFIDDGAFAPRAALVYKAHPKHTFRASYNRANSTVSNLQLNIDFPLSTIIPGSFDIWLYGNKTTQTFGDDPTVSWFSPAIPDVPVGTPGLPLGVAFAQVNAPTVAAIEAGVLADPNLAPFAPIITDVLTNLNAATLGTTGALSPGFNVFDGSPLGLIDAPISKISVLDVYEVGYKGLIEDKLSVSFDLYYSNLQNNSQFTAISPAYVLLGVSENLAGDLGSSVATNSAGGIEAGLIAAGVPDATAAAIVAGLTPVIQGAYTQAGDAFLNTPSEAFGGLSFSQLLGALPFHATTSTQEVPTTGGNHLAAGYRTFDERSFWGADLGLEYYFSNDFSAFFNYSWVSDNEFMQNVVGVEGDPLPTYLNIPKNKYRFGVNYTPEKGIRGNLAFQHDDSYFAAAGQFAGDTEERNLVDAAIGYAFGNGLSIDVSATNLLDSDYRYLPNMPKLGRRTLARLTYVFGANK